MSAPNASSSSSQLVSYAQDIDYTRTEGFKQFKAHYNVKNARAARNDPNGVYPSPEVIYQAAKGPGMTERSLDSLLLDDTGGKGSITQWVHAEYIVGSETICLPFTQWVRGGYFSKVPTKVPTR